MKLYSMGTNSARTSTSGKCLKCLKGFRTWIKGFSSNGKSTTSKPADESKAAYSDERKRSQNQYSKSKEYEEDREDNGTDDDGDDDEVNWSDNEAGAYALFAHPDIAEPPGHENCNLESTTPASTKPSLVHNFSQHEQGSEIENPEDMGAAATRDNLVLQNLRSNETSGAITSATIPQSNATLAHKGRVQWLWSQPGTRALLLLLLVLLVMEHMQEGMLQKAACNCLEREDCFLAVWFRTWNLQVYCLNE